MKTEEKDVWHVNSYLCISMYYKQYLETLHMNTTVKQFNSFVQVILCGQWNYKLQKGGEGKKKKKMSYTGHK